MEEDDDDDDLSFLKLFSTFYPLIFVWFQHRDR